MLDILNYFVKILTIIIGIILLTGIFINNAVEANPLLRVMGIVLIVWGIYRLIIYRVQSNRYKRNEDEDNEG
jgi:uncharacterized membrane protein HdeD (DUF308 family)